MKRESVYPTGLPVGEINVAIPHTDPEHVNNAAICLGILEKPVTFNVMGMEEKQQKFHYYLCFPSNIKKIRWECFRN